MTARTRALVGVVIMSALLLLYFGFAGVRAVALLGSGTPLAIAMGVALIVLPLIGVWALAIELSFGFRSTRIVDRLEAADLLPDDLGEAGPTGKADREVAKSVLQRYVDEAEAEPQSWQASGRLGIVRDACGDRPGARAALRRAIQLEREERRGGD